MESATPIALFGFSYCLERMAVERDDAFIRADVAEGCQWLGLDIDHARNAGGAGRISSEKSRVSAWVIPTDEELLIARDTFRVVTGIEGRY